MLLFGSISIYGQYSRFFTEYDSNVPSNRNSNTQNNSRKPQNIQITTGYFERNGRFFSIKLKIATISNDLVVLEYFDGDSWRECLFGESAFPIRSSNNLPEQLKYVCTHYASLSSFGYVYF